MALRGQPHPAAENGRGVRPVEVGETIRRLVGKVLLSTGVVKEQVFRLLPYR